MSDPTVNMLFLCTGNSARSIMAEAILRQRGAGRFGAFSAGSHPKPAPHPLALAELRERNHDVSSFRSKSWEEFAAADAPRLDFVITVCDDAAGEACPVWPGQPMTAHWGVEDPAAATGDEERRRRVFREVYTELENRIEIFTSLPFEQLDRLALKRRLDAIGKNSPRPPQD